MNTAIIKLGGSVLYGEDLKLNTHLLQKVVDWFESQKEYESIVFVIGGGNLSRFLLNQVTEKIFTDPPKHRIGIKVSHVNATIFVGLFNDKGAKYFDSISSLTSEVKSSLVNVATIGGVVEGWSTDMVAATIADELGVKQVTKISNIDYIYSADPNIEKEARPFEQINWKEYIEIFNNQIGKKHKPNMSAPLDIECSLFCKEKGIHFRVSGGNLERDFDELLKSGTLVS